MSQSRIKNSFRNVIVAFISNIFITILSLFTSKVIKEKLGLEVLGLNGVFSNIISVLSLSELGIGTAITFALYKPLAENNEKLIQSLMRFYKKAYQIVALIVTIIGLILLPFLKYFIKSSNYTQTYIIEVYLLFLLNSVVSYFLVYKRTLIIADQKNYIITTFTLVYTYVLKITQFVAVFFTSNYLLYLAVNVVCTFVYNLCINIVCNKLYPYLKDKNIEKLPDDVQNQIVNKIKALFLHSIGTVVVYGTDNILISYFCGIEQAGRYSSYVTIINVIGTLFAIVFDNIKDSVGNFLVSETSERQYDLFKKMFFINQSLVSICSICLLLLLTPLVTYWLGQDATVPFPVVLFLVLNFYFTKNNLTIGTIKTATGLFEPDRYAPLIESVLNLVSSITFAKFLGLFGIVAGTFFSKLAVSCWVGPYVVHKRIFNKKFINYYLNYLPYALRTIIIFTITWFIFGKLQVVFSNNIWSFLIECILVFLLSLGLWFISVLRNQYCKFFITALIRKIRGIH